MNVRQAKKIMREGTLDGHHNVYWTDRWLDFRIDRWLAFLGVCKFVGRETDGDHRIRKAITVYERRK